MPDLPPLIIDSFAGGGGASTGIELALGRSPDVAINHSAAALALHAVNHPDTLHLDSNIWDVDPRTVTKGRKVGLLWASPDCKHFSKAKGGAPRDRNIRDLAWVIVRWAEEVQPDVILMENVEEFTTWGPVDNDGQPIREFSGQTFDDWKARLRRAGYKLQHRELRACDYGAPTIRKRFFLIARRDGRPIVWPKPSHGDPKSEAVRKGRLKPWRTAAECIDWTLACPSIFDTGAQIMAKHGLRAVRPLAPNTLARVARGMKRYVLEAERPFLVNLTHGGRTEDLAEPFKTITGAHRGEKAVVAGGIKHAAVTAAIASIMGCGGRAAQSRPRGMDEPTATITGKADACLSAAFLAQHHTGVTGHDAPDPVSTIAATGSHQMPVQAFIARHFGQSVGHGINEPCGTVTAGGGGKSGLVAPWFAKYYGAGTGARTDEPAHTITVNDRFGHVQADLHTPPFGEEHHARAREVADFLRAQGAWDGGEFVTLTIQAQTFVVVDIGMRMLTPRELFNAQGFPADYAIDGHWIEVAGDWKWKPFPKDVQVSCCGNSVCPPLAEALVRANCASLMQQQEVA